MNRRAHSKAAVVDNSTSASVSQASPKLTFNTQIIVGASTVDELFAQILVPSVEQTPIHFHVPSVRIAEGYAVGDDPQVEEWTAHALGGHVVSGLVHGIQRTEDDDKKCRTVLAGVEQVGEGLFRIAIPSQALQEAYQSRQNSDQRSYAVDVRTATVQLMAGHGRFGEQHAHTVAVVDLFDVETDEILHVQKYRYQTVHLIAEPKIGKRDNVHGCGETFGQVGEQPASGTAKAAPKWIEQPNQADHQQ
ncbi:hypothetical protein T02_16197 [Trichinella nativa]|uniref:Uncharacterized protein n=1 Tax=Trichinella nativa TaxID=6335 RepID=A0A0V1LQI4_9BILA|nr:hypothetical protein T02_16197 [Trichinella nativa]